MNRLKKLIMVVLIFAVAYAMNTDALEVTIESDGGDSGFVYYYGQAADINVELSEPAYLLVYAINLDGDIRIVFPNADIKQNYVSSKNISLSSYSALLADMEGPLFMVAVASENGRLNFGYQDRNVPLWSSHWGEYHPLYSFISDKGFGRENSFPIVLARTSPRYYNKRLINDFEFSRILDELNDKIERDFNRFDNTIDYFLTDLNEAVSQINIEFASDTREFYIASSRYNSELYDQRGTSVDSGRGSDYYGRDYYDRGGYYYDDYSSGSYYGADVSIGFDMHLNSYGHWVYIDGIRMWRPYVHFSWRPYVHGFWRWSIRGWLWICFSPWDFTYNYGYWHYDWRYGWVWLPDYSWHPAWVEFYYYGGYTGWRPAPLPHVYRSRVRSRDFTGHTDHNPYVFVSSRDFTAGDIASKVIPDDVFSKNLKPALSSKDMVKFSEEEGSKFFDKLSKEQKLSIKTADLEKTTLKTGDDKQFEAIVPKLDSKDKEAVQLKQKSILKEVEIQKKSNPQAEKSTISSERVKSGSDTGIITRNRTWDSKTVKSSETRTGSKDSDKSIQRSEISRDKTDQDSKISRDSDARGDYSHEKENESSKSIIRSETEGTKQISIIDRDRDFTSSVQKDSKSKSTSDSSRSITRPSSSRTVTSRTRSESSRSSVTSDKSKSSNKSSTTSKSNKSKSKNESSKSDSKDSDKDSKKD